MQTIQFKVSDNYLNVVLTLLDNLKIDIIKELKVIKDNREVIRGSKTDKKIGQFDAILNMKSSEAITIDHNTILNPHSELSRDIS